MGDTTIAVCYIRPQLKGVC